jgi:hypothetical protein
LPGRIFSYVIGWLIKSAREYDRADGWAVDTSDCEPLIATLPPLSMLDPWELEWVRWVDFRVEEVRRKIFHARWPS